MKKLLQSRASWAIYDQALVSAANFLSTLIVARMLPPESFAMFSLASLAILFFSSFQRTLITQPLNVLGANENQDDLANRYIGLLYLQRLIIPIAVVLLSITGIFFFPDLSLIISAGCYLTGFFLQEIIRRYHYTRGAIRDALMNDLISYGGQLIILIAIYSIEINNPAFAFAALAATSLIAFAAGQVQINKTFSASLPVRPSEKELLSEHWNFAKWVVLSQFVYWGSTQAYPFMLAGHGDYISVADFNVANSILNAMNIVRLMLGNYLPSKITAIYSNGGSKSLRNYMIRIMMYSGVSSLLLITILISSSNWLIEYLFSGKYPLAGELIGWLAFAHFFTLIGVITNAGALALRTTNWIFYANLVGTIFSTIFGPILIVRYGVWGAVTGLCIASAIPTVIQGIQIFYQCRPFNDEITS